MKPTAIMFPATAIGSTSTFNLLVENTGPGQLAGTVNTPPAQFGRFGLSGSGSFLLAPRTATTITLTYTPTSTTRTSEYATVVSNSLTNGTIKLKLQGTGIAPPP